MRYPRSCTTVDIHYSNDTPWMRDRLNTVSTKKEREALHRDSVGAGMSENVREKLAGRA